MSRSSYSNKTEADDLEKVGIKRLKNEVRMVNGQLLTESVHLGYYDTKQQRWSKQQVQITTTPCYYGGARFWFMCPLECQKRVGVLYLHKNEFGCRKCHNLTYRSKNTRRGSALWWAIVSYKCFLLRQPKRLVYAGKLTKKYKKWEKYIKKMEIRIDLMNKN